MINRQNWLFVLEYLDYLSSTLLQSEDTVSRRREQLRHVLEWLDNKPFNLAQSINPTFPIYLLTARNDGKKNPLAPTSMRSTCNGARAFFPWGKIRTPRKFTSLSPAWIDTIRPARFHGVQTELKIHEYYSLAEIQKIAGLKLERLRDIRDQAAMCFMYLSGMRVGAFVTLPINCVDLLGMRVNQLPSAGVRTKNSKAAQTSMYPIPELLKRVYEWDMLIRALLPEKAVWYSSIDRTGDFVIPLISSSPGRREKITDGIKRLCEISGVTYKSAHKLRHGHVMYGLKAVKDMAGLKAVS